MAAPDPVLTLTSSETAMQEPLRRPADTVSVDTGDERLRSLRRMQGLALGLLGLALIGLMTAHLMGAQGVWGWVRAFCEAAAVGALADWFAVVALFRHPLGQRWIPHTAIIPSNKERIADNLAVFVRDKFLAPRTLLEKLQVFDPASRLAHWLTDPDRIEALVRQVKVFGLEALDWLDDDRLQQALRQLLLDTLHRWDAATSAGQVLTLLTRDGRHQALLDEALARLGDFLGQDEVKKRVSALMVKYARQEYPTLTTLVNTVSSVESIGDSLAERLAKALMQELQEVLQQPEHPVRQAYGEKVEAFIAGLRTDPALQQRVQDIKAQLLDHPGVHTYVDGLVGEVKAWLRRDLQSEHSALTAHLRSALDNLGSRLAADPALRDSLNTHIVGAASRLVAELRDGVATHIAQTVKSWDNATLVREMELSVGKDLQYIRLNGTLVGGLMGLLLYALGLVLPLLLSPWH